MAQLWPPFHGKETPSDRRRVHNADEVMVETVAKVEPPACRMSRLARRSMALAAFVGLHRNSQRVRSLFRDGSGTRPPHRCFSQ
jgi:hypothetical protein